MCKMQHNTRLIQRCTSGKLFNYSSTREKCFNSLRRRANWSHEPSNNNAQRQHGNNPPITHLKLHAEWPLLLTTRNTHKRHVLLHAGRGETPTSFIKTTLRHEKTTSQAAKRASGVAMKQDLKQPQTQQPPPHADARGRDTHLHHDLHAEHKQDDHHDIPGKKKSQNACGTVTRSARQATRTANVRFPFHELSSPSGTKNENQKRPSSNNQRVRQGQHSEHLTEPWQRARDPSLPQRTSTRRGGFGVEHKTHSPCPRNLGEPP